MIRTDGTVNVFLLKARTNDLAWKDSLKDANSTNYKETAKLVEVELTRIIKDVPGFILIEILGFEKGSVLVFFRVHLNHAGKNVTKMFLEKQLERHTDENKLHFKVFSRLQGFPVKVSKLIFCTTF